MVESSQSSFMIVFALYFILSFHSLLAIAGIWIRVAARLHDPRQTPTLLWRLIMALDRTYLGPIIVFTVVIPITLYYAYLIASAHFVLAGVLTALIYVVGAFGFLVGGLSRGVMTGLIFLPPFEITDTHWRPDL
jgi:hypothetical protein